MNNQNEQNFEFGNITLISPEGVEVEFEEVADIFYNEKLYALLSPLEDMEDVSKDEALVFEVIEGEEKAEFILIEDEEIIDAVFAEYEKLLEEE